MKRIYFVSRSKRKYEEVKAFLEGIVEVEHEEKELPKLQLSNIESLNEEEAEKALVKLVEEKAKKAFEIVKRPVLVEHTSLCIEAFHNLRGLDTNYFSSTVGYKNIIEYCSFKGTYDAYVESIVCLCDGKGYYTGWGRDEGEILHSDEDTEDINGGFGWDTIFVPEDKKMEHKTYELLKHEEPGRKTMRIKALEDLVKKYAFQDKGEEWDNLYVTQENELDELAQLISDMKVMLFVGAGISASVGFPDWGKLIGELGENVGYKAELFKGYGNYMMLAEYAKIVEEDRKVYDVIKDTFAVTDEMKMKLEDPEQSEVYQKLLELDFPVIYTTNYDHLLEEYYKIKGHKCRTIITAQDLDAELDDDCTRIMKFHGDVDNTMDSDDNSIVLSESQYFQRMDFTSFMDEQFQKDMGRYHILFLGYSLSDINVKMLMYLAHKRSVNEKKSMKAYIYTATPNLVQREVFKKNGITSFTGIMSDKRRGTLEFLNTLLRRKNLLIHGSKQVL